MKVKPWMKPYIRIIAWIKVYLLEGMIFRIWYMKLWILYYKSKSNRFRRLIAKIVREQNDGK